MVGARAPVHKACHLAGCVGCEIEPVHASQGVLWAGTCAREGG
jgi:hypothetical protein